jgi:hypothetical protein
MQVTCVTGGLIAGLVLWRAIRRDFDPFAPVWLFLAGYFQVYVIQAWMYREYAIRARGAELVLQANIRALWAIVLFLVVYHLGIARRIAARLPKAPQAWSASLVGLLAPPMILWGLACAGLVLRSDDVAQEENLLRQFPILMLAAGVMLTVTGRRPDAPRPMYTLAGVLVCLAYAFIWMFNGRRSHAVIGILTGVAAWYLPRLRRPRLPIMVLTAIACAAVVSLALGFRNNPRYERSASGFLQYLSEFDPSRILVNLNLKDDSDPTASLPEQPSKETEEYGGFLLMMHTVPELSDYDYGANYLRVFSTFIPRLVWPDKPIYGREAWINAWIAGSEFRRDESFTGPAISILGAAQLNGGALATVIVMTLAALGLRIAYDYFRYHADAPWAQVWWSLTYYNAWLMTVNDDPLVWFYYIYGHTTLPPMAALWIWFRLAGPERSHSGSHQVALA